MTTLPDTAEYWNDIGTGRRIHSSPRPPEFYTLHSSKHPCAWATEKMKEPDWQSHSGRVRGKKSKVTCKGCLANWPKESG